MDAGRTFARRSEDAEANSASLAAAVHLKRWCAPPMPRRTSRLSNTSVAVASAGDQLSPFAEARPSHGSLLSFQSSSSSLRSDVGASDAYGQAPHKGERGPEVRSDKQAVRSVATTVETVI